VLFPYKVKYKQEKNRLIVPMWTKPEHPITLLKNSPIRCE
jgi:hypothetical protein